MTDEAMAATQTVVSEPPPLGGGAEPWYYSVGSERKGPVSEQVIRQMLDRKELNPDATQVWRKGMSEWKLLRNSELGCYMSAADLPPPVASSQISNVYVWLLAASPFVGLFIQAMVEYQNLRTVGAYIALGGGNAHLWKFPGSLFSAAIAGLAFLDTRLLQKAGYKEQMTLGVRALAVFLAPIYMFKRARILNQKPTYGIAWIASFILGFFFLASVG